jgi:hypothetical protein
VPKSWFILLFLNRLSVVDQMALAEITPAQTVNGQPIWITKKITPTVWMGHFDLTSCFILE